MSPTVSSSGAAADVATVSPPVSSVCFLILSPGPPRVRRFAGQRRRFVRSCVICSTRPEPERGRAVPVWRLRDFSDDDLDQAIQVWDQSRVPGSRRLDEAPGNEVARGEAIQAVEPVFPVAEVVAAARAGQPAVVAEVGEEIVGMAVAQIQGDRAWVMMVALAARWRQRGIGSALLAGLERRLRTLRVRRICALVGQGATGTTAFENSGYARRDGLVYYELLEHLRPDQANLLAELGGRLLPPGLWSGLAGMENEKRIIE